MARSIDDRIETLLDQLEARNLSDAEIERIQKKIEYLKSQQG